MGKKKDKTITIIQDTREQMPLDFSMCDGVEVEVGMLWPGDYSVKGFEKSIAFERKSVSDLIGTLKDGYAGKDSIRRYESRFDLELEEFERHYNRVFVIVEPDGADVITKCRGRLGCGAEEQIGEAWYRSAIEPSKVFRFLKSLEVKYGCHVYLAMSRGDAAREIAEVAKMYVDARRHVIHRGKIKKGEEDPW